MSDLNYFLANVLPFKTKLTGIRVGQSYASDIALLDVSAQYTGYSTTDALLPQFVWLLFLKENRTKTKVG